MVLDKCFYNTLGLMQIQRMFRSDGPPLDVSIEIDLTLTIEFGFGSFIFSPMQCFSSQFKGN